MNASEITNKITNNYPTLEVNYQPRRGQITVYGFHTLKNAAEARAELEQMGFQLGPNNGTLRVEQVLEDVDFGATSDAAAKASREYWSR